MLSRERALVWCRCRCDHTGAEQPANLDGRDSRAARCAQHQKLFACAERRARTQRIEGGQVIGTKRSGDLRRDAVRQGIERFGGDDDLFGKRARARHPHYAHPGLIAARCAGGFVHDACEFGSGNEGQGILGLIAPLHLQTVNKSDSCSLYPDTQLSGPDAWRRNVLQGDLIDRRVLLDDDGFHVGPLLSSYADRSRHQPLVSYRHIPRIRALMSTFGPCAAVRAALAPAFGQAVRSNR
ncbi:hypothetical protein ACVWXM_007530 [Bradyrhizobium sp. GM7.3]